jgi:hypothetical protein
MVAVTRTATLFVRHNSKECRCKDKDKGNDWQKCKCVKTMLLYDGVKREGQRQWKQSTKRRVWEEAEQVRREWLDSFDPTKIELKRLRMEKELKTVPLEVAVEKFLEDLQVNNRAEGTVNRQALFGKKSLSTSEHRRRFWISRPPTFMIGDRPGPSGIPQPPCLLAP